MGEEYANNKDYNNALAYYNESGILFKKLNYEIKRKRMELDARKTHKET
jgi:hypothetical protein